MAMTVLTIGTKAAATDSTPVLFEFVIFLASSLPPRCDTRILRASPPGGRHSVGGCHPPARRWLRLGYQSGVPSLVRIRSASGQSAYGEEPFVE